MYLSACEEHEHRLNLDMILLHWSQGQLFQQYSEAQMFYYKSCQLLTKALSSFQSQANISLTVTQWTWVVITQIAMSENITRKHGFYLA